MLTYLGHALVELDQLDEAADACQEAMALRRELDQPKLAIESLAGLAAGEVERAGAHVETVLAHLQAHKLDGAEEALRVYLSAYPVLRAAQDPRAEAGLDRRHRPSCPDARACPRLRGNDEPVRA